MSTSFPPQPPPVGGATAVPGYAEGIEHADFRSNAIIVTFLAGLIGSVYVLFALSTAQLSDLAALVCGLFMMSGLIWRRRNPRRMLLIVTVAGILHMLLVPWPTLFLIAIPWAVYSYAR